MFGIGPVELLFILVIAFFIFGPKKLPELGKAIGKAIGEFKKTAQDIKEASFDVKKEPNQISPAPHQVVQGQTSEPYGAGQLRIPLQPRLTEKTREDVGGPPYSGSITP